MKYRILYFMDHSPNLGGAAHTLLRQAVLMKEAGNAITVVLSDASGKVCEDYLHICREKEIPTVTLRYTVTNQPEGFDICAIMESFSSIKECLQEKKPDFAHSVQLNGAVEFACRELRIPHVMNIYPGIPEFFRLPYSDIFPRYHICDSQYYATFWHTYAGTDSYCVRTMAPDNFYRRKDWCQNKFRFICVGEVYALKNQLEVIKAFERALREGLCGTLDFWGGRNEGGYWDECAAYIEENHLKKNICLHGFTSDMETVYKDSDVLICASRRESYPNAVSEALAHGLVVISTPVAGVPEVIRDRENGYLCEGYEAEYIVHKIRNYMDDCENGAIELIKENAKKTYWEVHAPQAVKGQLLRCYGKILENYAQKDKTKEYSLYDAKEEFGQVIEIYQRNRDSFSQPEWVKRYLWQIKYVFDKIRKEKVNTGCFIWGTGKYGSLYKEIVDVFAPDIPLSGFIDTYRTGTFKGYPILSPKQAMESAGRVVLIGVLNKRQQILDELAAWGFQYNEDMFVLDALSW